MHIGNKETKNGIGWTRLPTLCPLGSEKKLSVCTGCLLPIDDQDRYHTCIFQHRGFTVKDKAFPPCNVRYHAACITIGLPFRTRHFGRGTKGIQFPPCATNLPFICELCTVRTHLGREVDPYISSDTLLLSLERMRMIDAAHYWAPRTLENACRTLRRVEKFFLTYRLPTIHQQMQLPSLQHPPKDISIPIFWSMEHYTTFPSSKREAPPTWNTGRSQRSALSVYSAWHAAFCSPTNSYKDNENRVMTVLSLSPSDNILSRMTAGGIGSRLGTESKPSQALSHNHIHWNQNHRHHQLTSKSSLHLHYEIVAAQCVELIAWLGWLRSSEIFNLKIEDVELVPPVEGAVYNLPPKVGAILLTLLPSTKSSRNRQVDVVIAWETSSGLKLGYWLSLLFAIQKRLHWGDPKSYLFRSNTNSPWTSVYFRSNHLYPLLHLQRLDGDATLRHINVTSSTDIPYHFYSLHSYRRGAQGNLTRKRDGCQRRALPHEPNDHARWRIRNTGREDMPTHYREPSIEDRIYLTLLCF